MIPLYSTNNRISNNGPCFYCFNCGHSFKTPLIFAVVIRSIFPKKNQCTYEIFIVYGFFLHAVIDGLS